MLLLRRCVLFHLAILSVLATPEQGDTKPDIINEGVPDSTPGVSPISIASIGLSRRATCSAGQYYENGCRTCLAGWSCSGNDQKVQCSQGYYSSSGASSCSPCPKGTYTNQVGTQNSCTTVQGGWKANASSAATSQIQCGVGYYSPGATDTCTICPAGYYCNSQTNSAPAPCVPGRYAPTTGYGQDCEWCPTGYFNNVYGATSCCKCCSGWYNSQRSQTHCFNCPGLGSAKQGSPPASTSSNDCTFTLTDYVSSCDQSSSGTCPPTQAQLLPSTKAKRFGRLPTCANPNEKPCPIILAGEGRQRDAEMLTGAGSYECINVQSNLESCGGCISEDAGQDCTAIDHVNVVKCIRGKCVVGECKKGYSVSADYSRCVNTSRHKLRGQGHQGMHDF